VGAKGSGKTVYLRRLRAAAAATESVYADIVQQDLPSTSNIVKFCQCFGKRDLTEKWMQLWYCAIVRSLVTHLLRSKHLSPHLTSEQREELEQYPAELVPHSRREISVYSQVTSIIHRYHTAHAYTKFFDHPAWAELSSTISDIISTVPPIYFFIDSVDEEYASAPMYWLQCQKGLFFRAMRFLRDQHFGGRLHVIVCVRDHVLASVLRSEHQNRYRGEPHSTTLGWEYQAAEFFLKHKIARLDPDFVIREPEGQEPTIEDWLGISFIENRGRRIREPVLQYLLRHTRLLPRDIVILGNRLSEIVRTAKRNGQSEVPPEAIRLCVREAARSFGNEQLAICANHIASSGMPADAARMGYEEIYTGDTEYARGFVEQLHGVIQLIGRDRFGPEELELGALYATELFGDESDALSVLWQNRLLGYVEQTADGPREVFFSEMNCDHFTLPLQKGTYLLHSCMIDSLGIKAVGPPVGQGGMSLQFVGMLPAGRRVEASPDPGGVEDTAPDPGRIGSYPILGVIGRGGMGTVYLAEDTRLKRRVAIKVLPALGLRDAEALRRFEREAQVLAALNHPNIATVFSLEEDGARHFLTMEYVVGRTLASCIERGLAHDLTLSIGRQIALALEAAHRRGVVHRALKPSNIMVTPENTVKILDFGIAKVATSRVGETWTTESTEDLGTSSGSVLGTFGYMSPEQMRGRPVDNRSDIWAFGCCLYECLSGHKAFEGDTPPERMAATMEREPDWDTLLEAPAGIQILLKQCLAKDPLERLSDIADAIAVIDQAR
jgi:predicted Ser/Thr protein kinase